MPAREPSVPRQEPRVALVAAGAGARGAYEAGALSVLLPWLAERNLRPSVFVGTSAGAINASMFAAVAHLQDAHEAAKVVLDVWRSVDMRNVFRSPLISGPWTAAKYAGQVAAIPGSRVVSLLDSGPLRRTAAKIFARHVDQLRANVAEGTVKALAVVATNTADNRTTVFAECADGVALPPTDQARAIDYLPTRIAAAHVLASSAIPTLFCPIHIDGDGNGGGWFTDGGVRLNTPIKPALAFDADRVAVIATHPAAYAPPTPADGQPARPPDVVDGIVALLGTVLADRMVEDIRTLGKINELVPAAASNAAGRYREVPYIFIGPRSRGELGELASRAYAERFGGLAAVHGPDYWALRRLIGPRELGSGELLSYLFFDRGFIDDAIDLGAEHAREQLEGGDPWQIGQPGRP
jgi:NTE family protein